MSIKPKEIIELENIYKIKIDEVKTSNINKIEYKTCYKFNKIGEIDCLNLYNCKIIDLSFLKKFIHLESLLLMDNQISDISIIKKINKLSVLYLNGNNLSDISPIENLINLKTLYLGRNNISNANVISNLKNIETLAIWGNQLTNIDFIKNLSNLKNLYISENKIENIEPLTDFKLINLNIADNNIKNIYPLYKTLDSKIKIRTRRANLKLASSIRLDDNRFNIPPMEIIEMGKDSILEYFNDRNKFGGASLNECKVVFVGDGGVGKTSLMKRIVFDTFNENEETTHGINKLSWDKLQCEQNQKIKVNFWDFGGQHLQHSLHQFFLTKRIIYVLVLNPRNDENADYWLKQIENLGENSEILIVYNAKQEKDEKADFLSNYYELKKTYKNLSTPILVSCKIGKNITEFKNILKSTIISRPNLKDEYPLNWFKIKNNLEELVTLEKNYIAYEEYEKICIKNALVDKIKQKNLLLRLDNIGSIVFYDEPNLNQLQVLNPDWITTFAYSIITSEITKNKNGCINYKDLNEIFKTEKEVFSNKITKVLFKENQFEFILKLMIKYDLCQKNPFNKDEEFLFPTSFLGIPRSDYTDIKKTGKHYRFSFDIEFEKLIMYRFIARNISKSFENDFWQSGIYIKIENKKEITYALIETDRYSKLINCWILGDNIRGAWELIRSDINDICKIYPNLIYNEEVNYNGTYLSYNEMYKAYIKGYLIIDYHSATGIKNLSVLEVLENFIDIKKMDKEKIVTNNYMLVRNHTTVNDKI